jgi:formyltetrahydrofolate deformylase
MRVIIAAVGRDHWGLADPIVHYVTSAGAHIAEIQMYDRDDRGLFALLLHSEGRNPRPAGASPDGRSR